MTSRITPGRQQYDSDWFNPHKPKKRKRFIKGSTKNDPPVNSGLLNMFPCPFEPTITKIKKYTDAGISENKAFDAGRFLRNLNEQERAKVTTLLPGEQGNVDELVAALNDEDGNWSHEILKNPRFPHYGFAAAQQGKLQKEQLATLLMQREADLQFETSCGPKKTHAVFDGNKLSKKAEELLIPSLWKMTEEEKKELIKRIKAAPASERFFWTVDIPNEKLKGPQAEKWGIFLKKLQDVFRVLRLQEKSENPDVKTFVIPSFTILQSYLRVVFPENAAVMEPELGIATLEGTEQDLIQGKRPFALHFPGIDGLIEGDGYYFGHYLATFHDFYHAHRLSLIDKNQRLGLLRIAHVFQYIIELSKKNSEKSLLTCYWPKDHIASRVVTYPILKEGSLRKVEKLVSKIIDMDEASMRYLDTFRNRSDQSKLGAKMKIKDPKNAFFRSYNRLFPYVIKRFVPEAYFPTVAVIHDMVVNKEHWERELGVKADPSKCFGDDGKGIIRDLTHSFLNVNNPKKRS